MNYVYLKVLMGHVYLRMMVARVYLKMTMANIFEIIHSGEGMEKYLYMNEAREPSCYSRVSADDFFCKIFGAEQLPMGMGYRHMLGDL